MGSALKVTISLPAALHKAAERARKARKETRSQFFRNAIATVLREQREREALDRYVRAYQAQPEHDREIAAANETSRVVLVDEPWE